MKNLGGYEYWVVQFEVVVFLTIRIMECSLIICRALQLWLFRDEYHIRWKRFGWCRLILSKMNGSMIFLWAYFYSSLTLKSKPISSIVFLISTARVIEWFLTTMWTHFIFWNFFLSRCISEIISIFWQYLSQEHFQVFLIDVPINYYELICFELLLMLLRFKYII